MTVLNKLVGVVLVFVLVATANGADLDPTKPDKLKAGQTGTLKGTFTATKVNPVEKVPANATIKVDDKFVSPNFFNGTVQLTPQEKGAIPDIVVLLKIDTEGKKEGEEFDFEGTVTVSKHTREVFGGQVNGKNIVLQQTVFILTPKKAKK